MAPYKRYLQLCLLFTAILCLALVANYFLITNAYENISCKDIVAIQQQTEAIWGSALNSYTATYKFELFKFKKPELIALGSSQSYQFREEFFNRPFVSCGGVMTTLKWGRAFLREILPYHKPRLVILTLDFWYFNDLAPLPPAEPDFSEPGTGHLIHKLRQPFVWLGEGKITFTDYLNILLWHNNKNKITNYNNMGIVAIKKSDGFRKDGSYCHAGLASGFSKAFSDKKFATTLEHVAKGTDHFLYGDKLSIQSLEELHQIIAFCREHQIKLVVILPPVSQTLYRQMAAKPREYAYIAELRQHIKSLPVEAYDYFDICEVGSGDGECVDGFHAGDVAIQKMLLTIIRQNPRSVLRPYLDIALMEKSVKEYAGKAMTRYHQSRYNYAEVDFLEMGCAK